MTFPTSSIYKTTLATAAALILTVSAAEAAGSSAKGARLAEQWCNSCHTVTASPAGGRKFDPGPRFAELAGKNEGYLRLAIEKPHDFMPKFPKLSGQDKRDLIAHIRTLK